MKIDLKEFKKHLDEHTLKAFDKEYVNPFALKLTKEQLEHLLKWIEKFRKEASPKIHEVNFSPRDLLDWAVNYNGAIGTIFTPEEMEWWDKEVLKCS